MTVKTRTRTAAEKTAADAADRQATINGAWTRFADAVRTAPGESITTWIAYRRTCRIALAEHPLYLPVPPGPKLPDVRVLQVEYEHLANWAPSVRAGTVEGVGIAAGNVRRVSAEERADFERRAAAYRVALAEYEAALRDVLIFARLLTADERAALGPAGGYRERLPDYGNRAAAYHDRTGTPVHPDPRPADADGLAPPNPTPALPPTMPVRLVPLVLPGDAGSFDRALTQALAD